MTVSELERVRRRFRRVGKAPDPFSYIFAGLFILSIGFTLLCYKLGVIGGFDAFSLGLSLSGVVVLLDGAVRYSRPWTRYKAKPYVAVGFCLILSGLSVKYAPDIWWLMPLLVFGIALVVEGALRLRKPR